MNDILQILLHFTLYITIHKKSKNNAKKQLFMDKNCYTHYITHIITLKKLPFNRVYAYNITCVTNITHYLLCVEVHKSCDFVFNKKTNKGLTRLPL